MKTNTTRISSYALVTSNGKILLSKLCRGPRTGKWNLVGGGIGHGESPEEALVREVKEEAGILLFNRPELTAVLSDTCSFENANGLTENLHILGIIYRVQLPSPTPCRVGSDGDSSEGCQWFDINTVCELDVVPFVSQALKLI